MGDPTSCSLPSGTRLHNYGNHHFSWENPLFLWPFSIAMLNYQRVMFSVTSTCDVRWNPTGDPILTGTSSQWGAARFFQHSRYRLIQLLSVEAFVKDGCEMLLLFLEKNATPIFLKKNWKQKRNHGNRIFVTSLFEMELPTLSSYIEKNRLKVVSHHWISEWTSNIDCYVRVCDVVRIIHSCKLSCLNASPCLLAHRLQQNVNMCHPTPLNPFPLVTLVRNTPPKAWFNIESISNLHQQKPGFGHLSVYFNLGIPRISVHWLLRDLWDQLGYLANLRNGCLADAAACGRVLLRSQVLQLQGNLKPLVPWRGNCHTCDHLATVSTYTTHNTHTWVCLKIG